MKNAVIISPLRTPVGKFLGGLATLPAETLASLIIRAIVDRSGVDPAQIDEVDGLELVFERALPLRPASGSKTLGRRSPRRSPSRAFREGGGAG